MKLILLWILALIGSLIAGIIVSYIVPPIVDSIVPNEFSVTVSVMAIVFPIITFLCGLQISPGPANKTAGFILLAFVFTLGMVYITAFLARQTPPYQYLVYNYIFYILGCLIDLVIVLRLKSNPIKK